MIDLFRQNCVPGFMLGWLKKVISTGIKKVQGICIIPAIERVTSQPHS